MSSSTIPTANDATNAEAQEAGNLPPQDQHELDAAAAATPNVVDHSTPPSELPSATAAFSTPNFKIETDEFGNETHAPPTQEDESTPFIPEKVASSPPFDADEGLKPSAEPSPSKLPASTSDNNFLSSVLNATTPTNPTSSLNFGSAHSNNSRNENRDFDFSNFNFDFESLNGMFSSPLNGSAAAALNGVTAIPFPLQNGPQLQQGVPPQPNAIPFPLQNGSHLQPGVPPQPPAEAL